MLSCGLSTRHAAAHHSCRGLQEYRLCWLGQEVPRLARECEVLGARHTVREALEVVYQLLKDDAEEAAALPPLQKRIRHAA